MQRYKTNRAEKNSETKKQAYLNNSESFKFKIGGKGFPNMTAKASATMRMREHDSDGMRR